MFLPLCCGKGMGIYQKTFPTGGPVWRARWRYQKQLSERVKNMLADLKNQLAQDRERLEELRVSL